MVGPLAPVLSHLLQDLKQGVKKQRSTLQDLWPQIIGKTFEHHTKGTLLPTGTLTVWVDNSSLAAELRQRYQGTILKRVQGALGEAAVKKVSFRVGEIR